MTGATGYVGSRLVTELLQAGHDVFAATRDPERLGGFGWIDDVTAVQLDAADSESVRAGLAAAGPIDVIYYLVHAIGQPGFRDADRAAAGNVAAAAKDAGVGRIVYLGGFVPSDEGLSEHLASRAEVAEALTIDGGPDVVWLGAAVIFGAGSTSFEMMRYVADRFPVIPVPKWMKNPIDPISIRDVLYYLVAAADADQVPAGAYDIAGPDRTSYRDMLKTYARIAGTWQTGVPVWGIDTTVASWVTALALPVPEGLGRGPGRVAGLSDAGQRQRPARSGSRPAGWAVVDRGRHQPRAVEPSAAPGQRPRRSTPPCRQRSGLGRW